MQEHRIDPRFRAEPHGNHIDINQLYGYREQLRAIRYVAPVIAQQRQELLDRIDALLSSLDDPMRVVVAGGFNAGKSTFLNALVKRQVMPVKAIRSTCTVNTLKAGDREELIIVRRDGRQDIRVYQDDADVREQINTLMQQEHASIARIEVCCPNNPFLERFTLIDTPGLDHNAQDSATSAAEVERADALIWVLHNKGAEKLDHEQILRFRTANPDSPVIVILNQIDCLEEDERNDALATVKTKLGTHVTTIFPLSAKLADEGQRDRNPLKLDESRIGDLRDYLHLHLFNQYRDLQEKIRFNHRSQGLLTDLRQFLTDHEGAERMSTTDIRQTIQHSHELYEAQKSGIAGDLKKNLHKDQNNHRFHESAAIKAGLVNILSYTRELIKSEDLLSDTDKKDLETLIERIKTAKFRLGVFGSMKAGKSTLINTLLGQALLLPVDEDRCTAAYTLVSFADAKNPAGSVCIVWKKLTDLLIELQESLRGLNESLDGVPSNEKNPIDWIRKQQSTWAALSKRLSEQEDWSLEEDPLSKKQDAMVLLEALPKYDKTQSDYARNQGQLNDLMADKLAVRLVDYLVFYQDHPLLRHVEIIDSPGSGSATLRDTRLARDLIKQSDALLFLSEATTAFQKDNEMRLLGHVRQMTQEGDLNKLFILATKADCSEKTPEIIVQKIGERLDRIFKSQLTAERIYPLSCKTGLNLERFNADLNRFLQSDKDRVYLTNTSAQVRKLLASLIGSYEKKLSEKEDTLEQLEKKIKGFQEEKSKTETLFDLIYDSYHQAVSRSRESDVFGFMEALSRTHKESIQKFQQDLVSSLKNKSDIVGAQAIMQSAIIDHLNNVSGKTILEIQPKVEKLVNEKDAVFIDQINLSKEKLEKTYGVFQVDLVIDRFEYSNDQFVCDIDGITTFSIKEAMKSAARTGGLMSLVGAGGATLGAAGTAAISSTVTLASAFTLGAILWPAVIAGGIGLALGALIDANQKLKKPEEVAKIALDFINKKISSEQHDKQWVPPKILFEEKLGEALQYIVEMRQNLLNDMLDGIEEKLNSQLLEQQKNEKEKAIIQSNRRMSEEELQFLDREQDTLRQRIEVIYAVN